MQIVAGLEPEATNIMLQMLAAAAQRGPPAAALVAGKQPVAAALAGPSAGTAAAAGGDGADAEGEGARAAPHVAFARQPLDRLLPALARQLAEARSSLSGGAAAPGGQEALARCQAVQEVAANAAVLARSLEALQGCARAIAVERDAWRQEAAKLATRLQEEERAEAAAAAASAQRMAALDARLAVSRQHLGVVCGLRR